MIEQLQSPTPKELDALTVLWEESVRATHHFLAAGDIEFFRPQVRTEALPRADLWIIRGASGRFEAFMGIEGKKIEMLFVAPAMRGRGLGRQLTEHALELGARQVDVNEQNNAAAEFYLRRGFSVVLRDEFDPLGKPYPILHLEA